MYCQDHAVPRAPSDVFIRSSSTAESEAKDVRGLWVQAGDYTVKDDQGKTGAYLVEYHQMTSRTLDQLLLLLKARKRYFKYADATRRHRRLVAEMALQSEKSRLIRMQTDPAFRAVMFSLEQASHGKHSVLLLRFSPVSTRLDR